MNYMTIDTPDAPWNQKNNPLDKEYSITDFIILVDEAYSNDFYEENEVWILKSEICYNWIMRLYKDFKDPEETAKIIERAYKIYSL